MLILFDVDDTLISSYMDTPDRSYDHWQVLPGRRQRIAQLMADGHQLGIVTNQAGVAFGHVTEAQVHAKLSAVAEALDLPATTPIAVCFTHPQARMPEYRDRGDETCRKPSGAMIRELMACYPAAAAEGVLYVGDRPDDREAARDAGATFVPATAFFGDERLA
ncbi:MAG TPA: HAD-IIIA family hydrolase [Herpetosiphonaceae bacterium]